MWRLLTGDASIPVRGFRGAAETMAALAAIARRRIWSAPSADRVVFSWLSPAHRWLRATAVRGSEYQNVGRYADYVAVAEKLSLGLEEPPAHPTGSVDLGSSGQVGSD